MAIEKNGFEIHSVWQFTPISLSRVIVQLAALFGIFQALPTAASRWGRGHIQAEPPLLPLSIQRISGTTLHIYPKGRGHLHI